MIVLLYFCCFVLKYQSVKELLRAHVCHVDLYILHRRSPSPEETTEPEDNRSIGKVYGAFDSHFHLDRPSKRLLGNLSLTMETWTDESTERPSTVPVNLIGGTLIYCDPESFPSSVSIDDKLRVAIGVHPKKVHGFRKQHYQQFISLVQSRRVAAIGEIGLDRAVSEEYWAEQLEFLETTASTLKTAGKPIILHVRSTRQDKFSSLLYLLLSFRPTRYSFFTVSLVLSKFPKPGLHSFPTPILDSPFWHHRSLKLRSTH
jgi:Tat protein secretion system quality control protein TatD with DNase activity